MLHVQEAGTNPVYWFRKDLLGGAVEVTDSTLGEIVGLYGLGPSGSSIGDSLASRAIDLRTLIPLTGQWSAVLRLAEGPAAYLVLGDYSGFQRIYIVDAVLGGADYWIVSHDFDTAAALASRFGRGAISWDLVRPTLTSQHNFMTSSWSSETWHSGIVEVHPGSMAQLTGDRIIKLNRPFFNDGYERSYDSLIADGIDRAIGLITDAVQSSEGQTVLYLSGGRDSRMCLSLILAAGVQGQVSVASEDPNKFPAGVSRETVSRDLAISHALERRYGLRRFQGAPRSGGAISYMESLERFQSASSGLSYEFSPQKASARYLEPLTEFRGAGGELIRSAYSRYRTLSWWSRLISDTPDSFEQDARALFGVVTRAHLLPKQTLESSRARFSDALRISEGRSLAEQLSLHYALHRNRAHFGGLDRLAEEGRKLIYPLALPEFHFAAQKVPFEERAEGDLAFKVIEAAAPDLNRIPFDNAPGWPERIYHRHAQPPPALVDAPTQLSDDQRRYFATIFDSVRKRGAINFESIYGNALQFSESFTRSSLFTASEVFSEDMTSEFAGGLLHLLGEGKLNANQSATRLRSLLAMGGLTEIPESLNLVVEPKSMMRSTSITQLSGYYPAQASGGRSVSAALEMSVSARSAGRRVLVEVATNGLPLQKLEFAFYLRGDGIILDRRWYQTSNRCEFALPESVVENLTVMAFARAHGGEEFILRVESAVTK